MSNQANQAEPTGAIWLLGLLILVVIAFGTYFFIQQSNKDIDDTSTGSSGNSSEYKGVTGGSDGSNRPGGPSSQAGQKQGIGGRMVVGTVTAADASSITVETSDGTSRTFTVTSSTEVLPGRQQPTQAYDPNDIEIGSTEP